ncbi:MAG: hypothetical protein AAGM67_20905, partial [Bacteroidota bacterium]
MSSENLQHVNLKSPPLFTGEPEHWEGYVRKLKSYLVLTKEKPCHEGILIFLKNNEMTMNEEEDEKLYAILTASCQ